MTHFKAIERWLKQNLKKKVSITKALVITFLMTGSVIGTAADQPVINGDEYTTPQSATSEKKEGLVNAGANFNTVIGWNVKAEGGAATAIGRKINITRSNQATAVGYGIKLEDAVGATVVGSTSKAVESASAFGYGVDAIGVKSVAVGRETIASGKQSIAIGAKDDTNKKTTASGEKAIAIGSAAQATANDALAIGVEAKGEAEDAIAIGVNSLAKQLKTLAIGTESKAQAVQSTAIGYHANANGLNAIAFGIETEALAENAVSIGKGAHANSNNTTSLGTSAIAGHRNDTAIGMQAKTGGTGTGDSVALGYGSHSFGQNTTAIGAWARVENVERGLALGSNSVVTVAKGIALGAYSKADRTADQKGNIYLAGQGTVDSTVDHLQGAVSVGGDYSSTIYKRQIINVAAGSADTDAVNVAQLKVVERIAQDAKTAAGNSGATAAQAAQTTATAAQTMAQTAQTVAQTADGKATAAQTAATQATQVAQAAQTTANSKIGADDIHEIDNENGDTTILISTNKSVGKGKVTLKVNTEKVAEAIQSSGTAKQKIADGIAKDETARRNIATELGKDDIAMKSLADGLVKKPSQAKTTLESGLELSYKANDETTAKKVSLSEGLKFKNGTKTMATVKENGEIIFDLNADTVAKLNSVDTVIYEKADGMKVVKANDGKFYPASQVKADGTPKTEAENGGVALTPLSEDEEAKLVAKKDGKAKQMGNVASGLDLANTKLASPTAIEVDKAQKAIAGDNKDGKGGLLTQATGLDKVATVGDLQAVAQAGLDFTGNDKLAVHRPLGTTLSIIGEGVSEAEVNGFTSASGNIAVVKNSTADTNELIIKLTKELKNIDSIQNGTDGTKLELADDGIKITKKGEAKAEKLATTDDVKKSVAEAIKTTADNNLNEYVDVAGNKLVKDVDGQFYPIKQDGTPNKAETPVAEADVVINQKGTAKQMGNVASGLGLKPAAPTEGLTVEEATKAIGGDENGNTGLLDEKDTKVLNKVATVGDLQAVAKAGLNFAGDSGEIHKNLSETLEIVGGAAKDKLSADNIGVNVSEDGTKLEVKLAKDLKKLDSIELGDSADTNDKTSTKLTKAGLIAKDSKGEKAVEINGGDKPAINFAKNDDGTGKGQITGLAEATDDTGAVTKGQMDKAIKAVAANSPTIYKDVAGNELVKAKDNKFYPTNQVNADGTVKTTDENGAPLTVTPVDENQVVVETSGVAKQMGNVASGLGLKPAAPTEGLTVEEATKAIGGDENGNTGLLDEKDTKVLNKVATVGDLQAVAKAGLNFAGDSGEIHKNLSETLEIVGGAAKDKLSDANIGVNVSEDGTKLEVKLSKELKGLTSVETVDKEGNSIVQSATGVVATDKDKNTTTLGANGVSLKDNTGKEIANLSKDGLTFAGKDGKDGLSLKADGTITGVKAGETDDSVANKGQMDTAIWSATKKEITDKDGKEYITGKDGKLYAKNDVDSTTGKPHNGATAVDKDTLDISINANDGKAQQLGNVSSGLGLDNVKITKKDDGTYNKEATAITEDKAKGAVNKLLENKDADSLNTVATVGDLQAVAQAGIDFEGNNSDTDNEVIHKALSTKLNIIGEGNSPMSDGYTTQGIKDFKSAKGNILVTKSFVDSGARDGSEKESQLVIKLSKKLKDLESVETIDDDGNLTVQSATGVVVKDANKKELTSLTKDGLKFADKKDGTKGLNINADGTITGLTESQDPTGAATKGEMSRTFNKLGNEVGKVKDEARGIGALNAALAGLKPMQYDPLQKTQVMAAIGNYKDKQAVAIGAAHYFNENLMMNAGVSLGRGERTESTANIGVTWKIGSDDDREDLPSRYKKGPISSIYMMQGEMENLLRENQMQKEKIKAQEAQIKEINEKLEILLKQK